MPPLALAKRPRLSGRFRSAREGARRLIGRKATAKPWLWVNTFTRKRCAPSSSTSGATQGASTLPALSSALRRFSSSRVSTKALISISEMAVADTAANPAAERITKAARPTAPDPDIEPAARAMVAAKRRARASLAGSSGAVAAGAGACVTGAAIVARAGAGVALTASGAGGLDGAALGLRAAGAGLARAGASRRSLSDKLSPLLRASTKKGAPSPAAISRLADA